MTTYDLDDVYTAALYGSREEFKRRFKKIIENRGEMPEPKTASAHIRGWSRRVGVILGAVGGTAGLVIGDILAWQNLAWPTAIGATACAVAVAGGSIWYCVDEYDEAHR
jgi:hypothetical protein